MISDAKRKRILVIEDMEDTVTIILAGLKAAGEYQFEAETVADPNQYVEKECYTRRYDLVVVDLALKEGVYPFFGFRIISDIAFEHPGTPIVVFSGHAQTENVVKAMTFGAVDFISKADCLPHELGARITTFFDRQAEALRNKRELEALVAEKYDEWRKLYSGRAIVIAKGDVVAKGDSRIEALMAYGKLLSEHKAAHTGPAEEAWPDFPEVLEIHGGEV